LANAAFGTAILPRQTLPGMPSMIFPIEGGRETKRLHRPKPHVGQTLASSKSARSRTARGAAIMARHASALRPFRQLIVFHSFQ